MDKQIYLYKLNKYKLKLESQPNNIIYQQKVTHYEHMIGGNMFCKHWKPVFIDTSKTIYNYDKIYVTINHNNINNNFYIGTSRTTIDTTGNFIGDNNDKRLIECKKQSHGQYTKETVNCKITTEGFLYNNRGYHLLNITIENTPSFSIKAQIIDNALNNTYKIDLLKDSSKIRF